MPLYLSRDLGAPLPEQVCGDLGAPLPEQVGVWRFGCPFT